MTVSQFWSNPASYCRWAARTHPAIFYSLIMGAMGPISLLTIPPVRRRLGYENAKPLPIGYPMPQRARDTFLSGYED